MPRRVRGADAAKNPNHFSGGVYVGKILLGRQSVRRTRAVGRNPFGNEIEDFMPAYFIVLLFCSTMVLYRNSTSSLPSGVRNRPSSWLDRYRMSTA